MDVYINKDKKAVEWNVEEKVITIHNEHALYAFKHGKNMLMIKEKYEASESGFSTYDKEGNLVFSYKYLGNRITFLIVLKEVAETSSLLIYDEKGELIAEIISPRGYIFVSLKNNAGNIMVVAHGTNDMTRDSFGRNDWNFVIDFEYFSVQKKSIIQ